MMMKAFLLLFLAFTTANVQALPQLLSTKQISTISEGGSKGSSIRDFDNFGKSFSAFSEKVGKAGGDGFAAANNGVNNAGGDSNDLVGDGLMEGASNCRKDCVEEGFLGPINSRKVVEIGRHKEGVYASLATFESYSKFAELLTGSKLPSKSKEELNKLCLRTLFTEDTNTIQGYNNGTVFNSECVKSKIALSATCKVGPGNTNTEPSTYPVSYSSVYTDEESSVLVAICFNDGSKVWFVLTSKSASLTPERKKLYISKVAELGMSTTDVMEVSYKECSKNLAK